MNIKKLILNIEEVDDSRVIRINPRQKFDYRKINRIFNLNCSEIDYIVARKYYNSEKITIGITNPSPREVDLIPLFSSREFITILELLNKPKKELK